MRVWLIGWVSRPSSHGNHCYHVVWSLWGVCWGWRNSWVLSTWYSMVQQDGSTAVDEMNTVVWCFRDKETWLPVVILQTSSLCICRYSIYSRSCHCPLDVFLCILGGHSHKWAKFHLNRFAINCHVDRISWQRRCLSKLWERLPWGERPAQQRLTNRGTSWVLQGLLVRKRQMDQRHRIAANVSG